MANFRMMLAPLTVVPTATSTDSNWPVTNVNILTDLAKKWAAAVATGIVDFTFDLGVGNTFSGLAADPGIFIDDVNVTSIKLQANATNSWGTPSWDQAVTVAKCGEVQRYKGFWRLADLSASAVAYRYVNVRILSQTPTDAANYRMSRAYLGSVTELTANPEYDFDYRLDQATEVTKLAHGGRETSLMGPRKIIVAGKRRIYGATELSQEQTIHAITPGAPVVLWDASYGGGVSQSAWLVERVDMPSKSVRFLDLYDAPFGPFEEVV